MIAQLIKGLVWGQPLPFTPPAGKNPVQLFGASLALWLRADAGVGVNGSNVTGWLDQSAAGLTLTIDPASPPQYVPSQINNLPGINGALGGTLDAQIFTHTAQPPALLFTGSTPFALFFDFTLVTPTPFSTVLMGLVDPTAGSGNDVPLPGWFVGVKEMGGSDRLLFSMGTQFTTVGIVVNGSTAMVQGQTYRCIVTYDGSGVAGGVDLYVNGVLETPTIVTDNITSGALYGANSQFSVFAPQYLHNNISTQAVILEAYIVNRNISTSELASSIAYNTRY